MTSCRASNPNSSSVADTGCRCKSGFCSPVSFLGNTSRGTRLFRCHRARSWWWVPPHRLSMTHCNWCSLRRAMNRIFPAQLLAPLFGRWCWDDLDCRNGMSHRNHRKHMNMAPWSISRSRRLVYMRDICCHQWWRWFSRIPGRFCIQTFWRAVPPHTIHYTGPNHLRWICENWILLTWVRAANSIYEDEITVCELIIHERHRKQFISRKSDWNIAWEERFNDASSHTGWRDDMMFNDTRFNKKAILCNGMLVISSKKIANDMIANISHHFFMIHQNRIYKRRWRSKSCSIVLLEIELFIHLRSFV